MKTHSHYRRGQSAIIFSGVLVCSALTTSLLTAAPINYGDFDGATVMYLDVTESSGTDPLPLFGAPSLIGSALDFDPTSFVAFGGGSTTDITDGQLNFKIMASEGAAISGISISETGDYTLTGSGSSDTVVSVGLPIFYKVLAVDGVAITPIQGSSTASISYNLTDHSGIANVWSMGTTVDINDFLTSSGVSYDLGATSISIVLNDTLVAISEPGTVAFIAKKDFGITPKMSVVPEPTTAALMLFGALLLAPALRKR